MVLCNLSLVLNNETIKVYDNFIDSFVYEGSSDYIPSNIMSELVRNVTIMHEKDNRAYFLITLN